MVKPPEVARKHYEQALSYISQRYVDGIQNATWKDAALKAADTWKAAIQKAAAEGKWEKGIEAASDEEWRQNAIAAASVIPDRIRRALDKWEKNWTPKYQQVIQVVKSLPPRTLDWNQNIEQRLKPVVRAWKEAK